MVVQGPSGTSVLWDGDRCFHYGSRSGKKSRLVLGIEYSSPFAFVLSHNWVKDLPFARWMEDSRLTEEQRLVLGKR